MPLLWCSFADSDKPKGKRFLGVVITEAADVDEASDKCWKLGINPGGEMLAFPMPPDCDEAKNHPHDVLLTQEQVEARGAKDLNDCPPAVQEELDKLQCGGPGHGRLN